MTERNAMSGAEFQAAVERGDLERPSEEAAEYSEPPTQMNDQTQKTLSEDPLLIELDALFKRYKQVEHVAVWGGSFEREHGARMELKPVVNKMFDTLLALLECRASRPEAADSVLNGGNV